MIAAGATRDAGRHAASAGTARLFMAYIDD